jgi:flagellar motor switch protein FliN/FliY
MDGNEVKASPAEEAMFAGTASATAMPPVGDDGSGGAGGNLDAIMRIPVVVQAILGTAVMPVANLMKLNRGAIVPLDHRIGEVVDVVVNGRVVARGEVVVLEEDNARFGISLTEIAGVPKANSSK